MNSYTISNNDDSRSVTNEVMRYGSAPNTLSFPSPFLSRSFVVGANDGGNYTCQSMNECNNASRTIFLEQCKYQYIGGKDNL